MIFNALSSNSPLKNHIELGPERKEASRSSLSGLAKRVLDFAQEIFIHLSELPRGFFKGTILETTQNTGKYADREIFESLRSVPVKLNERGVKIVQQSGVLDVDESTTFSSKRIDGGKCFGGVVTFLDSYHKEGLEASAEKFKDGVPLEGVLTQEIYGSLMSQHSHCMSFTEAKILQMFRPDEIKAVQHQPTEEEQVVLDGVESFRDKNSNVRDLTSYVATYYEAVTGKKLPLMGWTVLKRVEFIQQKFPHIPLEDIPGLDIFSIENAVFHLNDLQIESTLFFNSGPKELLNELPTLETGTYALMFPTRRGLKSHAVALVVERSGDTFLYEPNFAIGPADVNNRKVTADRVFKFYWEHGTNRLIDRVKKLFNRQTTPAPQNSGYHLYKIAPIKIS